MTDLLWVHAESVKQAELQRFQTGRKKKHRSSEANFVRSAYHALVSLHIMATSAGFYPEIASQSSIPAELMARSASLRIGVHIGSKRLQCVVWSDQDSTCLWSSDIDCSELPSSEEALMSTRWGERTFRQCLVTFDADCISLVPDAFYKEEHKAELLQFQTGEDNRAAGKVDVPTMQAKMLFRLPANWDRVQRFFPNAMIFPRASLLLNYAMQKSSIQQNHFQFHVADRTLTVFVLVKGKVALVNTYEVSTPDDILYYLSGAAMRLGIDFSDARMEGFMEYGWDEDRLLALMREFSPHVNVMRPASSDNHVFETLFVQCAS